MTKKDKELKELLDIEANSRNNCFELSYEKPDPLMVAKKQKDEYAILICALFAYGNAKQIVKFLDSLDFLLLEKSEKQIEEKLKNHYYRFQNSSDVLAVFKTFRILKKEHSLEELFFEGYKNENNVLEGIDFVIQKIKEKANYSSGGFDFLVGNPLKRDKNGKIKRYTNFPSKKDNYISHVRPHGQNSQDVFALPIEDKLTREKFYTKHCFWLNASYVKEKIFKDI